MRENDPPPCGLTQEQAINCINTHAICQAYKRGSQIICGLHLTEHPRDPAGEKIQFKFDPMACIDNIKFISSNYSN
jgi:hypothetical protein